MTKRALIAEPDHDEALRQAAILKDEGFDAAVFTQGDLVALVEQQAPDVLVLRHERPGAQTGLALVPRLKGVAPGTAIVLTTSDLTPDAIDKNRKQKIHAEWYLRLPADRAELVAAARAMPEKPTTAPEPEAPRDPSRPPPLPPSGLRALG
jgi:DNA-binding response OmpR family regulator